MHLNLAEIKLQIFIIYFSFMTINLSNIINYTLKVLGYLMVSIFTYYIHKNIILFCLSAVYLMERKLLLALNI